MTKFYLFSPTKAGISAAGVTLRELPKTKHKSAFLLFSNPLFNSFSGKFSPKFIILSCKSYPQIHFLVVL